LSRRVDARKKLFSGTDAPFAATEPMTASSKPQLRFKPAVLGIGVALKRHAELAAALAAQGFAVAWRDAPCAPGDAALVCFEIDAPPQRGDGAIERAASRGARVLVIAEACDMWSIGERCQVAVAGASALRDGLEAGLANCVADTFARWQRERDTQCEAERADAQLRSALGIVGNSAALRQAWLRLRRAAALSDLPLLLVGETGTGKELMARAAHRLDPQRRDGPWIALNCAAIAPALAEAELFGVERGAYTGAHRDRRGLLRAADGGIVFLDEVGELSEELQAKLLRALQERRVLPVGGEREVAVNVRIVAATHRDLAACVREGRFREDLYYRLAVLPIELPPLRKRREDIAPLIDHLLARTAPQRRATTALHEALASCELPGNVRQLDNLLAQALVAAGEGETLDLAHLPAPLLRGLGAAPVPAPASASPPLHAPISLHDIFTAADWKLAGFAARCERELLAAALDRVRGNQAAMARLLGVTPRCVYTKLRKHLLA
jgi:transcriptional regulator with PAS, ATPase and Fis domain